MTEDAGEAQSGQPQFSEEGLGADRLMEAPPLTPGSGHLVCGLHHGRDADWENSVQGERLYPLLEKPKLHPGVHSFNRHFLT